MLMLPNQRFQCLIFNAIISYEISNKLTKKNPVRQRLDVSQYDILELYFWVQHVSPKVRQSEGSSVRRVVCPKINYIFSVRRFVTPKVKIGSSVRKYKTFRQSENENQLISPNINISSVRRFVSPKVHQSENKKRVVSPKM